MQVRREILRRTPLPPKARSGATKQTHHGRRREAPQNAGRIEKMDYDINVDDGES